MRNCTIAVRVRCLTSEKRKSNRRQVQSGALGAMPNWLASELCMVASFTFGAWKTFKVLKDGRTDYNLLKTWCLLGLLRVFEEYLEFLVSWVPFYWLGKCLVLALLFLPDGNIPTVIFERAVVLGMDNAHHFLNNLVVPNVVQFVVSLPWRLLLVVFPSLPPPETHRVTAGPAKKRYKGGLASRLQHLKVPGSSSRGQAGARQRDEPRSVTEIERGEERSISPPPLVLRTRREESMRDDAGVMAISPETSASSAAQDASSSSKNVSDDSAIKRSRPRRRRRSIGEIVRSAVTGDSQIRLRDHLFDLKTAVPTPQKPPALAPPAQDAADDRESSTASSENDSAAGASLAGANHEPSQGMGCDPARAKGKASTALRKPTLKKSALEPLASVSTRRRPSEFSRRDAPDDSGGGDEAGGGRSDGSKAGLRRRNASGRRLPERSIASAAPYTASGPSTALPKVAASSAGEKTLDARARKLLEWRRRRAEQADAKAKQGAQNSASAIGADAVPLPRAVDGRGRGRSGGGNSIRARGGSNRITSRRFRHVERFRNEMAKNAATTSEGDDARTEISTPTSVQSSQR